MKQQKSDQQQQQQKQYSKNVELIEIAPTNTHDINQTLNCISTGLKICQSLKTVIIKMLVRLSDIQLEKLGDAISQCKQCENIIIISEKCGEYQPKLSKFFERLSNLNHIKKFIGQFYLNRVQNNGFKDLFYSLQALKQLKTLKQIDIKFEFNNILNLEAEKKYLNSMANEIATLQQLQTLKIHLGKLDMGKYYNQKEVKQLCQAMQKKFIKKPKLAYLSIDFEPIDLFNFGDLIEAD